MTDDRDLYMKWMKELFDAEIAQKRAQEWNNVFKQLGAPYEDLIKKSLEYNKRAATNVNMPIDPDGQVMALLKDIEDDVKSLRELIVSRGRE